VLGPDLPTSPIATIPAQAFKGEEKAKSAAPAGGSTGLIQVVRNEYVTDLKVRVLGRPGPDRLEVTGPLRATDALIVSSSVPLISGTLIRFGSGSNAGAGIEPTTPSPSDSGVAAELGTARGGRTGPAPIGAPGSAVPRGSTVSRPAGQPPSATKAAAKSGANPVPY
jgi:hypothetical protein